MPRPVRHYKLVCLSCGKTLSVWTSEFLVGRSCPKCNGVMEAHQAYHDEGGES